MDILISDLIKDYEKCRRMAECDGKVIVMKNNEPDAVLLPMAEYEKLTGTLEGSDNFKKEGMADLLLLLPKEGKREVYTLAQLKYDLKGNHATASLSSNK